jgi:hypothetical protein
MTCRMKTGAAGHPPGGWRAPAAPSGRDADTAPDVQIAALYVEAGGCYFDLPAIDPWDQARDARLYDGPHPVVAHPPCARWGRYWGGAPSTWPRLKLGDDDGCFEAALAAVRRWGGVLEHPEGSHAWRRFGLICPPRDGGWVVADWQGGWTCCVEQGAYGHRARKATWLYACAVTDLPSLRWGRASGDFVRLEEGFHSAAERARAVKTGACQRLSKQQRAATPPEFRDLLISIARSTARHRTGDGDPAGFGNPTGIPSGTAGRGQFETTAAPLPAGTNPARGGETAGGFLAMGCRRPFFSEFDDWLLYGNRALDQSNNRRPQGRQTAAGEFVCTNESPSLVHASQHDGEAFPDVETIRFNRETDGHG